MGTSKLLLLALIFLVASCNEKEKSLKDQEFKKINYNGSKDYYAGFANMITPNKNYTDWQYVQYRQHYGSVKKEDFTIIRQFGDSLKFPKLNMKENFEGFFQGGHPNYICNYIAFLDNEKIKYVRNEEQLRDFIGKIDNLEEAIILAKTYGYGLDPNIKGSSYRIAKDSSYELHLAKFSDLPSQIEEMEITITKDGFFKSKNLGVYLSGIKCIQR